MVAPRFNCLCKFNWRNSNYNWRDVDVRLRQRVALLRQKHQARRVKCRLLPNVSRGYVSSAKLVFSRIGKPATGVRCPNHRRFQNNSPSSSRNEPRFIVFCHRLHSDDSRQTAHDKIPSSHQLKHRKINTCANKGNNQTRNRNFAHKHTRWF